MPELGFDADEVEASRDGLVLALALVPEAFETHLASIEDALDDARFVALSRRASEAASWAPDDPRIPSLAAEVAAFYLSNPERLKIITGLQARTDTAARYDMVREFGSESGSAGERLAALVEGELRAAGVRIPRSDPR
ncbi:hypothetical protein [Microbacterium natoriense]